MCSSSLPPSWSRTSNVTTDSSADPTILDGWTKPSRPSVVSGESVSRGKASDEVGCELDAVHELSLGRSRVGAAAADRDAHRARRERLDLELADPRTVERVGDIGPERIEVEVLGAASYFLVDREGDAHRGTRRIRPLGQIGDRLHDLGDARLVVRTEQRGPVARDDVVPDPVAELGLFGRVDHLRRVAGQHDRAAVVALVDDRRHPGARRVRRRVDMGDQADRQALRRSPARSRTRTRARSAPPPRGRLHAARRRGGARDRAGSRCSDRSTTPRRPGCRSGRSAGTARARQGRARLRAETSTGLYPSWAR